MRTFLEYWFYRVALFHKHFTDDYCNWSWRWMICAAGFYWLAISFPILTRRGLAVSKLSIGLTSLPLFVLMFYLTRDDKKNKKLFEKLSRKYRDERFKVLRGIGIWTLQLGSFILALISIALWWK